MFDSYTERVRVDVLTGSNSCCSTVAELGCAHSYKGRDQGIKRELHCEGKGSSIKYAMVSKCLPLVFAAFGVLSWDSRERSTSNHEDPLLRNTYRHLLIG